MKYVTIKGERFKFLDKGTSKFGVIVWLAPVADPESTVWVYEHELD